MQNHTLDTARRIIQMVIIHVYTIIWCFTPLMWLIVGAGRPAETLSGSSLWANQPYTMGDRALFESILLWSNCFDARILFLHCLRLEEDNFTGAVWLKWHKGWRIDLFGSFFYFVQCPSLINPSLWLALVPVILCNRPTPPTSHSAGHMRFVRKWFFLPTFAYPECTCMSNLSIHFKKNLELLYLENIDLRNN